MRKLRDREAEVLRPKDLLETTVQSEKHFEEVSDLLDEQDNNQSVNGNAS
jgi:hypothetical protein